MATGNKKFFRKILSGNRELTSMQTNIEQAVAESIKNPLTDGRLIENVRFNAAGTLSVEHKLNRNIRGYIVVKKSANVSVWDTSSDSLFLVLECSGAATLSLWIF